ncbi:MAG: ExbD/TolR family protein [Saprospiraceae bacterium]
MSKDKKAFDLYDIDEFPNPNRARRLGRVKEKQGVATDMNSMVDMAFLLLTFFMLTTTMYRPRAMELVMPVPPDKDEKAPEEQAVKASRALTLIAMPDDRLYYYRGLPESGIKAIDYGKNGLRSLLQKFRSEAEKPVALIKPHPDCSFANMVELLDEMNVNNIERYAIDQVSDQELQLMQTAGIPIVKDKR